MSITHCRSPAIALAVTALLLPACAQGVVAGGGRAANAPLAATSAHATAHAELKDAAGHKVGVVHLRQQGSGLMIRLTASGLAPGLHGAHVHTTGACSAPAFTDAGGHWNPTGVHHGLDNPKGSHMGDLPNIKIGPDGRGSLSYTVPGASLKDGDHPLLDGDGAAFVVHAEPDDMITDSSGNSGARVACGVITEK